MNAQLAAIAGDFEAAQRRLDTLADRLAPVEWSRRPAPERWSPLECVAHLNLTSVAMLPLVRDGIERAAARGSPGPRRYRRDVIGWMLSRALASPGRFKSKTAPAFVPTADRPAAEVLSEFRRLQLDQIACVRQADGLPIDRERIASPFNARAKYSVYSALVITAAHQHRHLWQAEQCVPELSRRP